MKSVLVALTLLLSLGFETQAYAVDKAIDELHTFIAPKLSNGAYTIEIYYRPTDRGNLNFLTAELKKLASTIQKKGGEAPRVRVGESEHDDESMLFVTVPSTGCWIMRVPEPVLEKIYSYHLKGPNGGLIISGFGGTSSKAPPTTYWPKSAQKCHGK